MAMTEKLYELDSYIKEFTATAVACEECEEGYKIVLDKTAFFPEGGGQGADFGFIENAKVRDVQIDGANIYHFTDKPLTVGETVNCKIDWPRRFRHMQNHSGEHIVSGVIHNLFGFDNVGFHLGTEDVTLDTNGSLTKEDIKKIELLSNETVYNNVKILAEFPSAEELQNITYRCKSEIEGAVRIVTITGLDACACCAPHVKNTGEIGIIKILSFERYKGGTRVHLKCGLDALADYNLRCENDSKISFLLKAKQLETAAAVESLYEKQAELKAQFTDIKIKYLNNLVASSASSGNSPIILDNDWSADDLRRAVNSLIETKEGVSAAFAGNDEAGYTYVLGSKTEELTEITKAINLALCGKGGGRGTMIFGSVHATAAQIREFFKG